MLVNMSRVQDEELRHWTMSTYIPSNYYMGGGGGGGGGINHHQRNGADTAIFKKRFDRIDWKKLGLGIPLKLSTCLLTVFNF